MYLSPGSAVILVLIHLTGPLHDATQCLDSSLDSLFFKRAGVRTEFDSLFASHPVIAEVLFIDRWAMPSEGQLSSSIDGTSKDLTGSLEAGTSEPAPVRGTDILCIVMILPTRRMNRRQKLIKDVHKPHRSLNSLQIKTVLTVTDVNMYTRGVIGTYSEILLYKI